MGKESITSIKVKRNQFPNLIPGIQNHEFGYVVYGNLTINMIDGNYTICSRSDDG